MNIGADVHGIDALQDWHHALCVFKTDAAESLSSIGLEIRRAYDWIDEQAKLWHRDARAAENDVVRAKAELNQRKTPDYSGRIPDASVQEEALARTKARLQYALDQVDVCRQWATRLPKMISEEYEGASRQLGNFLDADLSAGIASLNARITSLHAYTDVRPTAMPEPKGT